MSFTEQVKNELARVVRPDKESRSGELLALLRMGGAIVTGAQGKKGVEFSTGNSAVARRVLVCHLSIMWGKGSLTMFLSITVCRRKMY